MPIFDFLNPKLRPGLATVRAPVIDATDASIAGFGRLVNDPADCDSEIVRWPSLGTRPVDEDTGDQAGTTEGVFTARGSQRFFDRQGAVHARVSVDFAREFNCLLEVPLAAGG